MKKPKLAIVTGSFVESNLPLMQGLCAEGYDVDLYFCLFNKNTRNANGLDFAINHTLKYGEIYEIDYDKSVGCAFIRKYTNSHIYVYQGTKTGTNSTSIKKAIAQLICKFELRSLAKKINSNNYDFVELVGPDVFVMWLHKMLKVKNVLMSFHEVFLNHFNHKILHPTVEYSIKNSLRIRTFSESVKKDIMEYSSQSNININVVPFGLYKCYKDFDKANVNIDIPFTNYILFTGFIVPYKGLSFLYDSIKESLEKGKLNLVIAGKGNDPSLSKLAKYQNVKIINRWISNAEMVFLIRNCRFIVCPYLSASQSGIPQTAFVYKKPIVSTNVGGFSDIIDDGLSGYLVDKNSCEELKNKITHLYQDDNDYNKMTVFIENFEKSKPYYSWKRIINEYIELNKIREYEENSSINDSI